MAEKNDQKKGTLGSKWTKFWNFTKVLTHARQRTVEGEPAPAIRCYNRLSNEIVWEQIGGKLTELSKIEQAWENYQDNILKEVVDIYTELHLFLNPEMCRVEFPLFENGTGLINKKIKINQKDYNIPMPGKIGLQYPHGFHYSDIKKFKNLSYHELSLYGRKNTEFWSSKYDEIIDKICLDIIKRKNEEFDNKAKEEIEKIEKTKTEDNTKEIEQKIDEVNQKLEKEKKNIQTNVLKVHGTAAKKCIADLLDDYIHPREKEFENIPKNFVNYHNRLETLRSEILGIRDQFLTNLKYRHNYKIIKPVIYNYKHIKDSLIEGENFGVHPIKKIEDVGFEAYIHPSNGKEEKAPGFDENGWPLEVDKNGNVLLDIWDNEANDENSPRFGKTRRKVTPEFITDLDILYVASFVDNEFDSYRDDLRDGRWHPKSLTAIDYTMARNKSLGGEWKRHFEKNLSEETRKYEMKFNDGRIIKGERNPSHLNPAFDKRFLGKKWIHAGRRFYYAKTDGIASDDLKENEKGIISTRGFSHYIIERVTKEMKILETRQQMESGELRGARWVLVEIAKSTGGYDYGPRRFGKPFPQDPFDVSLQPIFDNPPPSYKKLPKTLPEIEGE